MGVRSTALAVSLAAVLATPALASPYSGIYVFGDSLSDNGNLAELIGRFPNPPSYNNSFTNGPVAAAILAGQLGYTLTPSLWVTKYQDPSGLFGGAAFRPGTNYAVAGATAAAGDPSAPINLPQQVGSYLSTFGADPRALYVIDIGGNDVRQAALKGTGATGVTSGVNAELAAIGALAKAGAANFLVVNVPNVGVIPEFTLGNPSLAARATQYSIQYDSELSAGLAGLGVTGIKTFDLYGFNTNLLANAASYGLTNTTTPCYLDTPFTAATSSACGANAANINSFVYWDAIHPTETVQALWATGFGNAIGVPEPAGIAVIGIGLVGLLATRRRTQPATL